ncbi:uncharacterized protein K02A2.6-like [Photinus pyralis]|nr:uncharacterized protein K02A2.6-like [Photinus pyralis]
MTANTTIKICREIFSRFGIPRVLVSDNGRNFVSYAFESFLKQNGIKHSLSAPYHPATNGLAERYVQTLKQSLRAINGNSSDVEKELCRLLLQYRKMSHSITKQSPSMLMFGREITSRLDLIKPDLNKNATAIRNNIPVRDFQINDRVAVRNYANDIKWKFGNVDKKLGKLHYHVKLDNGNVWKRHVDQLRRVGVLGDATPRDSPQNDDIPYDPSNNHSDVTTLPETLPDPEINTPTLDITASVPTNEENTLPQLRRSNRVRRPPDRLNL